MNKKTNPLSIRLQSISALVALLTISTLVACGGGGDSAGAITGGGGGGTSILAGDFSSSNPTPSANTVSMVGTASSNLVTVTVAVTGISDIYGASFDVTYDPTMAQFVNWSPGSVLEDNNQLVSYQVNAQQAGRVIVGVSRVASGSGANVGITRGLVTLSFTVTASGSSTIAFEKEALLRGQPPQPIGGIVFDGGTLIAN